ncbi:MAG TPA: hypothetical protein VHC44_17145 [Verrucomicrobiae bacterium]|nr:hypothetical protein [Verrucomicrobiae bacterium]
MSEKLDQSQMESLQRTLFSRASALRGELAQLTGEKMAMPLTLNGSENLLANIDSLEAFCAAVEGKLPVKASSNPATETQAAAPVVIPQIAQEAAVSESANLTQRTLAAKERAQEDAEVNKNQRAAAANQRPNTDGAKYQMEGDFHGLPFTAVMRPVKVSTLTEKILEARGCASLKELSERAVKGEFN